MSKIYKPGEIQFIMNQCGATAHPHSVHSEQPGLVNVMMMGGYTKLEESAVRIAAAMVSGCKSFNPQDGVLLQSIASAANDLAEATLAEAKRRQSERQKQEQLRAQELEAKKEVGTILAGR